MFRLINWQRQQDQLLLQLQPKPDPHSDAHALSQWLKQHFPVSSVSAEQNADFFQIHFYLADAPFFLTVEHYSEQCWIETGSAQAFLLLSELERMLSQNIHALSKA